MKLEIAIYNTINKHGKNNEDLARKYFIRKYFHNSQRFSIKKLIDRLLNVYNIYYITKSSNTLKLLNSRKDSRKIDIFLQKIDKQWYSINKNKLQYLLKRCGDTPREDDEEEIIDVNDGAVKYKSSKKKEEEKPKPPMPTLHTNIDEEIVILSSKIYPEKWSNEKKRAEKRENREKIKATVHEPPIPRNNNTNGYTVIVYEPPLFPSSKKNE